MKWLAMSVALGLLASVSSYADVDLWSPLEQNLPADISEKVYLNLEAQLGAGNLNNDAMDFQIEVKNLYCEIAGYKTSNPLYKCSYGLNGEFSGQFAKNLYQTLVKAGFESDCDAHDGTCDIDPITRLNCAKHISWFSGISFSCTISL